jgi:diguanylate cyclase (GGDEF)-like protein
MPEDILTPKTRTLTVLRFILSLLSHAILLGLVYFAYPEVQKLSAEQLSAMKYLPLVLAGVLLPLCLRFNRSRMFFAALNLALLYLLLTWGLPLLPGKQASLVYMLLCLLMPLNLLVFSELRERGVLTRWGLTRFMLILVPMLVGLGLIRFEPAMTSKLMSYHFIEAVPLHWTTFTQPAQLLMLLTLLVMNGRLFAQPGAERSALFGSLLAMLGVLHFYAAGPVTSLLTSVGLLMFFIALIQESWSMAYIDHLTGLPGRRALNERLLKLSGTYSIAMLDIDHFKKFNDRYGHDAGDEVLRMVAGRIKNTGAGGKVYRYGGEEFTIVFPSKAASEVMDNLEAVRQRVEQSSFYPARKERRKTSRQSLANPRGVTVTISIGIADHSERYPLPMDVIKAADKALYRAKKKGRNTVCN